MSDLAKLEKRVKVGHILAQANGSETFYPHWIKGNIYTEGVFHVAESAGAHWLLDIIASHQVDLRKRKSAFEGCGPGIPFQIWTLTVDLERNSAVVTCQEDSGAVALVRQEIEFTDFPCPELKLFCEQGSNGMVIMLPGER